MYLCLFTHVHSQVMLSRALVDAMGPGAGTEPVVFSFKGSCVSHPGLFKANKLTPRFIVLTEQVCRFTRDMRLVAVVDVCMFSTGALSCGTCEEKEPGAASARPQDSNSLHHIGDHVTAG